MQNSMYTTSGLTSLPNYVGGGYVDQNGRQQYGLGKLVKSITKPISKVLDKVIPNEIKPALPFLAAAGIPLGWGAGLGSFLAPSLSSTPFLQGAIGSGLLNLGSQASQEGFDKRGLNLGSLALSALSGGLSAPGAATEFGLMKTNPFNYGIGPESDVIRASMASTGGVEGGLGGFNLPTNIQAPPSTLDTVTNTLASIGEKGAGVFEKGATALDQGNIFSKDFAMAVVPGQIGAVADKAYAAAQDAKIKYDEQMAQVGQTVAKNKSDQINFIRTAMQKAEFTDSEIEDALKRSGFANGGRVKYADGGDTTLSPYQVELLKLQSSMYDQQRSEENDRRQQQAHEDYIRSLQESTMRSAGFTDEAIQNALATSSYADGGSSNKPQPMPINPELLAVAIFGKRLDELTSTQKNALNDYIDVPKKAKGGLMSLGGHEMDFRAAGGFVPIGKKERADDVPARLSKNEFVFTAKAVRNAGGGDIKQGAKKMYQLMKNLEARA